MQEWMEQRGNQKSEKMIAGRRSMSVDLQWTMIGHGVRVNAREIRVEQFASQCGARHLQVQQPQDIRMKGFVDYQQNQEDEEGRAHVAMLRVGHGITSVFEHPQGGDESTDARQSAQKVNRGHEGEDRRRSTKEKVTSPGKRLTSTAVQTFCQRWIDRGEHREEQLIVSYSNDEVTSHLSRIDSYPRGCSSRRHRAVE